MMPYTPVWNNRELVGYAKSEKSAEKLLRQKLQTIPKGWKIAVKERDQLVIDLCGLRPGFVYSIHHKIKAPTWALYFAYTIAKLY